MQHTWILNVLEDLTEYARANRLSELVKLFEESRYKALSIIPPCTSQSNADHV